jgi:outer membrane protein assembly factor BamD
MMIALFNCAGNKPDTAFDLKERFESGKEFLDNEKYLRAQEAFQYILIRRTGSDLGDDAQFYLGESYFLNKEYLLAISEYEKLTRKMAFSPYVEKARYRICEAYEIESPKYYHDQTYSQKALERYQEFIDDFPYSDKGSIALEAMSTLRNKMAKKVYETGVLYHKMDEHESSIFAYKQLLQNYYDTEYVEYAHFGMVKSYCLLGDLEKALDYLDNNGHHIVSETLQNDVEKYLENTEKKIAKANK